jgi:hypothetical protein
MKITTINPDRSVLVTEDTGSNPNGSDGARSWFVRPDQVSAHLETWDRDEAETRTQPLRPGDRSALADLANEVRRERERR